MPGLMEESLRLRGDAMQGLSDVGAMEVKRREENARAKAMREAAQGEMIGSIAGTLAGIAGGVFDSAASGGGALQTNTGYQTGPFSPGEIKGAPVMQGALPQSMVSTGVAAQRPNGIFQAGAIRNAPMSPGSLPSSSVASAKTPTSHWTDFLTDW